MSTSTPQEQPEDKIVGRPKNLRPTDYRFLRSIADYAEYLFTIADKKHPQNGSIFSIKPRRISIPLAEFFDDLSDRQQKRVDGIKLSLNDYAEKLGIGVVSVGVQPIDRNGENILPVSDVRRPTIGRVAPPNLDSQQVLAGFKIGANENEQFFPEKEINARTFSHGEFIERGEIIVDKNATQPTSLKQQALIIRPGSTLGVSVPVIDQDVLNKSCLPYQNIDTEGMDVQRSETGIYTCRYLTHKAALDIIESGRKNR